MQSVAIGKSAIPLLRHGMKFGAVGLAATFVHFIVLSFLVEIVNLPWPTLAAGIGSVAGIVTSYIGNYAWTFRRHEPHHTFVGYFLAAYGFSMLINTGLIHIQISWFSLHYTTAFVFATVMTTFINFFLSKFAIFERGGMARPSGVRVRPCE